MSLILLNQAVFVKECGSLDENIDSQNELLDLNDRRDAEVSGLAVLASPVNIRAPGRSHNGDRESGP